MLAPGTSEQEAFCSHRGAGVSVLAVLLVRPAAACERQCGQPVTPCTAAAPALALLLCGLRATAWWFRAASAPRTSWPHSRQTHALRRCAPSSMAAQVEQDDVAAHGWLCGAAAATEPAPQHARSTSRSCTTRSCAPRHTTALSTSLFACRVAAAARARRRGGSTARACAPSCRSPSKRSPPSTAPLRTSSPSPRGRCSSWRTPWRGSGAPRGTGRGRRSRRRCGAWRGPTRPCTRGSRRARARFLHGGEGHVTDGHVLQGH